MTKSQLIAIAKAEVGYIGKAYFSDNTNVKEAPNGKGKFNKYSRELAPLDYYNSPKDGADYCAIFIDWLFYKAAGDDMAEAVSHKPLYGWGMPKGWHSGAGAGYARDAYPADQIFTTPEAGDQIFYTTGGPKDIVHTGLVVSVDPNGDIHTIEGNWGCSVVERTVRPGVSYSGQFIWGYGRPSYDEEPAPEPEKPTIVVDKEEWDRLNNLLGTLGNENAKLKESNGILTLQLEKYQNAVSHFIEGKKLLEELK